MSIHLSVSDKLNQKRSKSATLVLFCDDKGALLGNLETSEQERALALIKTTGFKGELGDCVFDYALTDKNAPTLCVMGVGKLDKLGKSIDKLAKASFKALKAHKSAIFLWGDVICQKHFGQFVVGFLNASYTFNNYKSKKDSINTPVLKSVELINTQDTLGDYENALEFAKAIVLASDLAKDVANEPPNVANPSYIAKEAKRLGKEYSSLLNVSILDEKDLKKLGMGCFLSVSQGSEQEGKIAILEYFGKTKKSGKAKLKNPIALVGKGVTFDTGGISIKPSANMDEMKFDMGGAAAMLGVARGLCEARLAVDVVIALALAENMPSGTASRPGDIVTAMNGTTVEILNTDAEGRLVLCDTLCYVQDTYNPSTVIDAATLTGACVIALGAHRSGMYSNNEDLLFALEAASEASGDLVWHMPLGEDYAAQLKSPVADLQNIGGPKGGSVTAACFLEHFIKDGVAWSHLDIAGTAWVSGENKGATGRPVPLLMHYLKSQAQ